MSLNLLNLLKEQVTGSLANQASSFLDESEEKVTNGLRASFPALLGAVINKSAEPSGNTNLMDMIGGLDMDMLGDIGGLFGGGASNVNELLNSGGGIVESLLGDKVGGIVEMIAKVSGLKSGSSNSLLKMAAPFLMGLIGKHIKGKGLSFLSDLLVGQKDHVQAALPAGLGGILGFSSLTSDVTDHLDNVKRVVENSYNNTSESITSATKSSSETIQNISKTAKDSATNITASLDEKAGNTMGWIKWVLPLLIIGVLAIWGMQSGWFGDSGKVVMNEVSENVENTTDDIENAANSTKKMVSDATKNISDAASDALNDASDLAKSAFATVDEAAKSALDKISFTANSAGSQMMNYINGGYKGEGKVIFKQLTFESGSARMNSASAKEVDNLAAILKAYPKVNINIIGHTDDTGDEMQNKVLSQGRATAVKVRLMDQGIDGVRVSTSGLGSEQPIASNDTEDGRSLNRRIEVTIAK